MSLMENSLGILPVFEFDKIHQCYNNLDLIKVENSDFT